MEEQDPRSGTPAYLALAVGVVAIGMSAIFVRMAGVPGTVAGFYRMAIPAVLLLIPFVLNARRRPFHPEGLRFALLGGFVFAGDIAFWATGVTLSGATNPTLLANTAPLWVGLGAMIVFREKLRRGFWVGLFIAMAGAVLILGLDAMQDLTIGLGTLFGLLAGIFYGIYFLITQAGRRTLDSLSYYWISVATSAIVLLAANLLLQQPIWGYPAETYRSLIGLGVFSQGLGWLVINFAQGVLPATLVAPTLLAQPVVTGLIAVPLLGEALGFWQVVGGVLVLWGVYLVHRSRSRSR